MVKKAGDEMTNMVLRWAMDSWEDTVNQECEDWHMVYKIWSASICWGFILMEEEGAENIDYYIALETHIDREASTLMALSGFYRHANMILRSCLELTFLGLWFHNDQELYKEWFEDSLKAPFKGRGYFGERWLRQLLSEPSFKDFDLSFRLGDEVWKLYGKLSKATHAKGKTLHETVDRGDSVTRFRKPSFKQWLSNFCQVFDVTSVSLFLRYPRLFRSKRREAIEIKETISDSRRKQLEAFQSKSTS